MSHEDGGGISNSIGQLTQVSNANGTTSYTGFDAMGRVLGSNQQVGPASFPFSYSYDLAGDLLSETYPTGRTLWKGYDGAGRVSYVRGSSPGGQWTTYIDVGSYWPHGALYSTFYGNGIAPAYSYNKRLQMQQAWVTVNSDPNRYLGIWSLDWGSNNNNGTLQYGAEYYGDGVPQGSLNVFGQGYAYDNVNRLTTAGDSGWSRSYAYDKTGNGWVTANNGVPLMGNTPTSNVYNVQNQMSGPSYDGAGNQLNVSGDSLAYDAEGRMAVATEPVYLGGGSESFVYDALGQRTEKSSPSETFVYAYDAFGALAVKYAPWNTVLQEYVRMGGQLIATENSNNSSPCQTCYFVWDHLGSTRLVTDQNANVVARHDYLPFGEEIPGGWAGRNSEWGATNDTKEKFTGQLRDLETGLDYFHARYLSSSLGRFTSPDPGNAGANPYDPQSWNGYSYVRNNPLAMVDRSGMYGSGSDDGGCDDDGSCWGDYPPPPPSDPPQPPPPVITTQEEPVPRGSFPGGETLGLPPGLKIPGPFSAQVLLGLWDWDCSGGVCVPGFGALSAWDNAQILPARKWYQNLLPCAKEHYGLGGFGFALWASGQPIAGTKSFTAGSARGTSVSSKLFRTLLDIDLPTAFPTLVGGPLTGSALRVSGTKSAGAVLGRAVPYIGEALLAYDAY